MFPRLLNQMPPKDYKESLLADYRLRGKKFTVSTTMFRDHFTFDICIHKKLTVMAHIFASVHLPRSRKISSYCYCRHCFSFSLSGTFWCLVLWWNRSSCVLHQAQLHNLVGHSCTWTLIYEHGCVGNKSTVVIACLRISHICDQILINNAN